MVNADGSSLQQVATHSKIYPPAWFDNNVILYAGTDDHPETDCQDNVCFVDLANNTDGQVADLLGANEIADMPTITSYDTGSAIQMVMLYRLWDGSDNSIVAREIAYDGLSDFSVGSPVTAVTSPDHIDYYDVSPLMSIVYTEYVISSGVFGTLDEFHNRTFNFDGSPALSDGWSDAGDHRVDGFVGNPTAAYSEFGGGPWNGMLTQATLFHVERATVEWIP